MSNRMGTNMNLALALEGRAKPARENEQLVEIAGVLADLPDPQIDASFMVALEQRLMAEEIGEHTAPARHLEAVPSTIPDTPADEVVRRAPVVQIPKRRRTIRRGVAAVAVAASMTAFPVVAAAQSLPGSPFYGLKTAIERVQLAVFGTPVQDAFTHLDLADRRMGEIEQLIALDADPTLIAASLAKVETHLRAAESLVLEHATDDATIRTLGRKAAEAEQRLRSVRASVAGPTSDAVDGAIVTSIEIQQAVRGALGVPTAIEADAPSVSTPALRAPAKTNDGSQRTTTTSGGSSPDERGTEREDDMDTPDAAKKISEAAEGCQVPGSGDGLGDALAPLARVMCTY